MMRIMLIRLDVAAGVFGPGQQGVAPRLPRSLPSKLPTSPRMPAHGVEEFGLGPSLSAVCAYRDLTDLGLPRPCGAENRVDLVRGQHFVNAWPGDLGFEFHLSQRAPHGLSVQVLPVAVVGGLPVTAKRLTHGLDVRQPFDGSHAIMTGDNGAHRISMIQREVP